MGLGTDTDLHPGEVLASQLLDDGLDAVVAAGGAVLAQAQLAGLQGDVVKEDDDPGGGDLEEGGELQDAPAGEVHIGLGLEQEELAGGGIDLGVEALELQLVDLDTQLFGDAVDGPEAGVVAGLLIFPAGIAQADDEPVSLFFHSSIILVHIIFQYKYSTNNQEIKCFHINVRNGYQLFRCKVERYVILSYKSDNLGGVVAKQDIDNNNSGYRSLHPLLL